MRTSKLFAAAVAFLLGQVGQAQFDWNKSPGGDVISSTEYLGAQVGSTVPLLLKTIPDLRIDFSTSNIHRMGLNPNTAYTIGAFVAHPANGYLGLSPDNSLWTNGPGPYTRLHLHDGSTPYQPSFRRWMRNGITFTTNLDHMYVGHKIEPGDDQTSAVIQWGDNNAPTAGPDVLKFLFTADYVSGNWGINGMNGLELGRFHPAGRLGLGDWQSVGLQPMERLDLLDGRERIRQLPSDPEASGPYKVVVVDDSPIPSGERGVLKWKSLSDIVADDCDWTVQPDDDVSTAYPSNPGCPQMPNGVGIGVQDPVAKLHVYHKDFSLLNTGRLGTWSHIVADPTDFLSEFQGVFGESGPEGEAGFIGHVEGVRGKAYNAKITIGVNGHGLFNSTLQGAGTGFLVGVKGIGQCTQTYHSSFTAGVYGGHDVPNGTPNVWAGYFAGRVAATGYVMISDASLKTGMEPLEDALGTIMALNPQRYSFRTEEFPQMNLPEGTRMGLISQEVQEVLPNLVVPAQHPAQYDSTGAEVHPAVDYLAMNYTELIPLLIAGMQEQNARIDQLEQQLAACCAAGAGEVRSTSDGGAGASLDNERQLRIQPNPFNEATTVSYTLEQSGRMQLMASSADGKQLKVLEEAQREAGDYRFEWNTSQLSPGVYYITLLLNGEQLVKRAVKVAR